MTSEKIDLETSLVAPELRDKLFRVDAYRLSCRTSPAYERSVDYVSNLTEAMIRVGVFTPVLIDSKHTIIAGHGLVDAATRIGLEDIPALRVEDLSVDELDIYAKSMARYFGIAELDHETYLAETQQVRMILSMAQVVIDGQSGGSEAIRA